MPPDYVPSADSSAIFLYISSAFWNVFSASVAFARSLIPGRRGPSTTARSRRRTTSRCPAGPDRLAADDHVHRVRVHLREVPQRHPTNSCRSCTSKRHVVRPCRRRGCPSTRPPCRSRSVRRLRVVPVGGRAADGGAERHVLARTPPSPSPSPVPAASSFTSPKPGATAVHLELQGVGVAVGDVGAALGDALAPRGEIDRVGLAELHVHAALADAAAGDAREVGLAARPSAGSRSSGCGTSSSTPARGRCPSR